MEIKLRGCAVSGVLWEYTIVINLTDGAALRLESSCEWVEPGATPVSITPETNDDPVGLRSGLLGRMIDEARVDQDGTLHLGFEDGSVLRAPADPDYEAWSASGVDGSHFVCLPGGEIATWGPRG